MNEIDDLVQDDVNEETPAMKIPMSFTGLFKDNQKPTDGGKCSFVEHNPNGSLALPMNENAMVED